MKFLSEERDQISAALAKFHSDVKPIPKAATNPHFGNRYADLATITSHIRPTLADCKLSVLQTVLFDEQGGPVRVETLILHESGQGVVSEVPYIFPERQSGPQAHGSSLTYARRYGLTCALGIAAGDDDDDGSAGEDATPQPQPAQRPARQSAPQGQPDDGWRIMRAKFDAKQPCDICGELTVKGDHIAWKSGQPARHASCHTQGGGPKGDQANEQANEGAPNRINLNDDGTDLPF